MIMKKIGIVTLLTLLGVTLAAGASTCKTESVPHLDGHCVNSNSRCTNAGGRVSGKCGLFDVCCVYEGTCGGTSNERPACFQNERYSQTDPAPATPSCTYRYEYSSNTCGVEINFVDFVLQEPFEEGGQCDGDYLIITNGLTSPIAPICGDMSGQSMIFDVDSNAGYVEFYIYRSSDLDTIWNIKMNSIHCVKESENNDKEIKTSDISERNYIDDIIVNALEELRIGMVTGYPDLGIPPLDPLQVGKIDFVIDNNEGTKLEGHFSGVSIKSLSSFEIVDVSSSVLMTHASLNLSFVEINNFGEYNMTGVVANTIPIYGSGPFGIDVRDIALYGFLDLGTVEEGFFGVTKVTLGLHASESLVEFENIEGGGEMGEFVNGVLSDLGPDFFNAIATSFLPLLEEAIKEEINNAIHANPTDPPIEGLPIVKDESVNDFFDILFANLRQDILNAHLDPFRLPSDQDDFTIELFNNTLEGKVFIGDGSVNGLSTIHRDGDMTMEYHSEDESYVVMGGYIGLIDMEAEYTFKLDVGIFHDNFRFSFKISHLTIDVLTDVFLHQSNLTLAKCEISDLGPTHFHIQGVGPTDTSFYNLLLNGILGLVQSSVTTGLQNYVCNYLEQAITGSGFLIV